MKHRVKKQPKRRVNSIQYHCSLCTGTLSLSFPPWFHSSLKIIQRDRSYIWRCCHFHNSYACVEFTLKKIEFALSLSSLCFDFFCFSLFCMSICSVFDARFIHPNALFSIWVMEIKTVGALNNVCTWIGILRCETFKINSHNKNQSYIKTLHFKVVCFYFVIHFICISVCVLFWWINLQLFLQKYPSRFLIFRE